MANNTKGIISDIIPKTKKVIDDDKHTIKFVTNQATWIKSRQFVAISQELSEEKRSFLKNPHAGQEVTRSAQDIKFFRYKNI